MSKSHKSLSAICTAVLLTTMIPSLEAEATAQKKAVVKSDAGSGTVKSDVEDLSPAEKKADETKAEDKVDAITGG